MPIYALAVSAIKDHKTYVVAVAYHHDSEDEQQVELDAIKEVGFSIFPRVDGYHHHSVGVDRVPDEWIEKAYKKK